MKGTRGRSRVTNLVLLGLPRSQTDRQLNELVGLAHLIGVPNVECPTEPRPGSPLFKRLATPVNTNGEEEPSVEKEQLRRSMLRWWCIATPRETSTQSSMLDKVSENHIPNPYVSVMQWSNLVGQSDGRWTYYERYPRSMAAFFRMCDPFLD